jgi:serine/threonine protein kinase/tetratricopeptide (TPR) repeat protein
MADDTRLQARRAFMEVADLPDAERAAALTRVCGGDATLRAEVESILRAQEQAVGFMEAPTVQRGGGEGGGAGPSAAIAAIAAGLGGELEGQMIGRYKLLQLIGQGGFGSVWMAEQREPVKRRVALKIIKLGMDTRQVIARFEAERQALAMMDHPNIARVLDAGASDTGRPYFVMEYIKGVPILEYCNREKLSTRARLELFTSVCHAIQHAHQKGVIHRDIKPSNVLVTMHDGVPVPKVIDFGIAKAISSELTSKTLFTEHRQMIGTPAYMSPEQAEMSGLDIDTRSDVYSLGVLLYELLTGTTPFAADELLSKGYAEMMRIIREVEPQRPSTRLSTLAATASRGAAPRAAVGPKQVGVVLKGDLDWIVMKCLEKDRTRRYETASGLASDVRRHLCDEPVRAGPPSATYKLRKFVRRNRTQVVGAGVVAGALVLGVVGTSIGMVRANRAAESERVAKVDAERKRKEAETNLAFAKKANELLGSVFTGLNPGKDYPTLGEFRGALRDNLDKAVKDLDGAVIGDSADVAAMQNTLGLSLLGLGEAAKAVVILEKASATREAVLGEDHPDTLTSRASLAAAYVNAGKVDLALPLSERTLKLRKARLGPEHPDTLKSMEQLAVLYSRSRRLDLAVPMAEEALRLRTAAPSSDSLETISSMHALALVYAAGDKPELALPLYEESLRVLEARLGRDHPSTLSSMVSLANARIAAGDTDRAVPLYEEALRLLRAKLGRDHPSTLLCMGNLAAAYQRTGKPDLAMLLYEETLKLREAKLGLEHPETIGGMNHLAAACWQAGKVDQALGLYAEVLRLNRVKFGDDHTDTLRGMDNLANSYRVTGKLAQAMPLYEEVLKLRQAKLGSDHPDTLVSEVAFGRALLEQRSYSEAEPLLLTGYQRLRAREGSLPQTARPSIAEALDGLIALYTATDRPGDARKWQAERAAFPRAAPVAK